MSVAGSLTIKKSETVVKNAPDNPSTVDNSLASKGFKYCTEPGHTDLWIAKPKRLGGYKTRSCPQCDKLRSQDPLLGRLSAGSSPDRRESVVAVEEADEDSDLETLVEDNEEEKLETSFLLPIPATAVVPVCPVSSLAAVVPQPAFVPHSPAPPPAVVTCTPSPAPFPGPIPSHLSPQPPLSGISVEQFEALRRELDREKEKLERANTQIEELKAQLIHEEDQRFNLSLTTTPASAGSVPGSIKPYKIVLLGESLAGKSAIYTRYTAGIFSQPSVTTMGVVDKFVKIPYGSEEIVFHVCDTAGQERFRALAPNYYRHAHAAIFCFDVTNAKSLQLLQNHVDDVNRLCGEGNLVMGFIGNKTDLTLQRQVPKEDGEAFALKCGGKYFESSAKLGTGVHIAFQHVIEEVLHRFPKQQRQLSVQRDKPKRRCCPWPSWQ